MHTNGGGFFYFLWMYMLPILITEVLKSFSFWQFPLNILHKQESTRIPDKQSRSMKLFQKRSPFWCLPEFRDNRRCFTEFRLETLCMWVSFCFPALHVILLSSSTSEKQHPPPPPSLLLSFCLSSLPLSPSISLSQSIVSNLSLPCIQSLSAMGEEEKEDASEMEW